MLNHFLNIFEFLGTLEIYFFKVYYLFIYIYIIICYLYYYLYLNFIKINMYNLLFNHLFQLIFEKIFFTRKKKFFSLIYIFFVKI
jgi:hypothetical protein